MTSASVITNIQAE